MESFPDSETPSHLRVCVFVFLCLCVYMCMCLSVCVQTAGFWRERIAEQFCSAQLLSAAPAVPPATAQKYTATKIQKIIRNSRGTSFEGYSEGLEAIQI